MRYPDDMSERIGVKISEDSLLARLSITAGPSADIAALEACLAKAGITEGIDWALLARIGESIDDPTYTVSEVIARGSTPVAGIDGKFLLALADEILPGRTRPDGSIDYRDRHSLTMVGADELLATIHPPTHGRTGMTVTGRELPAKDGARVEIAFGPGVEQHEQELRAGRAGVLSHIPGKRIDVVQYVEHKDDVSYASGHLEVRGSIEISGDVKPGFSVVASDDVMIKGCIEAGTVCAGNNISVSGGAIGRGTELVAGHDLSSRHSLEATLRAGGQITLGDHSINSRLAAERVTAEHGRGTIVGGDVQARTKISLREAGSSSATKTMLSVAIAATEQAILVRLRQDTARDRRRTNKRGRKQTQRQKGGKSARIGMRQAPRIAKIQRKIESEQARLLAEACIQVTGTAHIGVRIRFAGHEVVLDDSLESPIFVFDQELQTIVLET